jgi:DNA-binding MarR family transcriptional regulator
MVGLLLPYGEGAVCVKLELNDEELMAKKIKPTKSTQKAPSSSKESRVMQLGQSPIHLLHRAGQCAGDVFQTEMRTEDLTPRQFAVLVAVSENEGLSQTNLVEMTGIDRSTLADIIRRMLKKGLVQRRRTKEDARAYAVKLTEEGRRILQAAEPMAKKVDATILEALPAPERERFLSDLNMIVEALGKLEQAVEPQLQAKTKPAARRKG